MAGMSGFSFDMNRETARESFVRGSNAEWVEEDEEELQMVALLRLPTQKRVRTALMRKGSMSGSASGKKKKGTVMEQIDVRNLNRSHRERLSRILWPPMNKTITSSFQPSRNASIEKIFSGKYIGMGRCSFKDSLKALEADIQYANTLALGYPRDKDGGCFQMRISYSPAAKIFLFLVQWADYRLAGALGLLRILIYVTYGNGKNTISIYERNASIRQFYSVIFPALLQLEKGVTDLEERKQKEVYALRYQRKNEFNESIQSEIDIEREEECGVCLEVQPKVVLPNCCHYMCLMCYKDWSQRSQSCPFCRDSLKRINSGDLWIYTDMSDIVDLETIFKENCKMLFLYIEKLPLIVPDPRHVFYDPFLR